MKVEITNIHKTTNPEKTSVVYALSKEKENKMFDDRFYVAIMLAHRLYELRRGSVMKKPKSYTEAPAMFTFKQPQTHKKWR